MAALYIHIPFCKTRCNYCDFYKSTSCAKTEDYIEALEREMDVLLSTGEQQSVALMSMALEAIGLPVVSLTGWQAGILTGRTHQNASIQTVRRLCRAGQTLML